jgi:Predicted flavoproteins
MVAFPPFQMVSRREGYHAASLHNSWYTTAAARFIKPALYSFSNRDLMEFFSARGLPLAVEPDGRVFPETYRAEDALRVLLREAERLKVEILTRTRASRIKPVPRGFELFAPGKAGPVAKSLTMILATGGRAYPQFSGSDDGYRLAAQLGHRVVPLAPL